MENQLVIKKIFDLEFTRYRFIFFILGGCSVCVVFLVGVHKRWEPGNPLILINLHIFQRLKNV